VLVADFEVARREFSVRVQLEVAPGERVALLGRSGAGKTTTVEAIAGLLRLSRGEIHLGGRPLSSARYPAADLPPGRRGVGLLRQNPGLFPHLTVLQNIGYARGIDAAATRVAAQRLGLGALLGARPRGLSGGHSSGYATGHSDGKPTRHSSGPGGHPPNGRGMGMIGMRARARSAGGDLAVRSPAGPMGATGGAAGVLIEVRVPLRNETDTHSPG